MSSIGIGLAGFGTVGGGVWQNLRRNAAVLEQRTGLNFAVRRVALRDLQKKRAVELPPEIVTTDWRDVVADPAVRIVVELMGGIEEPYQLVTQAIAAGKIVVTANKALLAEHGREIFALAQKHRVPVFYEAAVAGGIPIIKAVREAFVGNRFFSLHAILNGTSNYILTRMQEAGLSYIDALAEAQQLGYAEADPALDVNGWDAAHKAIILASLAYGFWLSPKDVLVEGIEKVSAEDIRFAKELGYRIKLLANIRANERNEIEVRVVPTLIQEKQVLASVDGVFNAVWLFGDVVGASLFYGRGAGENPTASSVIADLVDAAYALESPRACVGFTPHALYGSVLPVEKSVAQFYLRLAVEDRPGVLAKIAGVLAEKTIGISSVIQPESHESGAVPLVLMIHDAAYGDMLVAIREIGALDCIKAEPVLFHVENFS